MYFYINEQNQLSDVLKCRKEGVEELKSRIETEAKQHLANGNTKFAVTGGYSTENDSTSNPLRVHNLSPLRKRDIKSSEMHDKKGT
jgi:hypothetical protein